MRDMSVAKGRVRAAVYGPDGQVKQRSLRGLTEIVRILFQAKWRIREMLEMLRYEVSINHNLVTDQGDALIADALSDSPERTKVDNANGVIGVGTGFTEATKGTTGLETQTGSSEAMDAGYPQLKGSFGSSDDNVVQYRATFEAGDLDDTGINEAALGNGTDNLAYAEISPSVNVGSSDTLQVDWEITFTGA